MNWPSLAQHGCWIQSWNIASGTITNKSYGKWIKESIFSLEERRLNMSFVILSDLDVLTKQRVWRVCTSYLTICKATSFGCDGLRAGEVKWLLMYIKMKCSWSCKGILQSPKVLQNFNIAGCILRILTSGMSDIDNYQTATGPYYSPYKMHSSVYIKTISFIIRVHQLKFIADY